MTQSNFFFALSLAAALFIAYAVLTSLSPLGEIVLALQGVFNAIPDRLRD